MQKAKNILKRIVRKFFLSRGYGIIRYEYFNFLELLLQACLKKNGNLFFIQIGANDGIRFDPIYEFVKSNRRKVGGIVLEPLRDFFEELKFNYGKCPNILPLNVAIHNSRKMISIYRVDPKRLDDMPDWYKGTASFNIDHFKLSGISPDLIVKEEVECLSLNEMLDKYQVSKVDLLQIDAEGYDSEIILDIDFKIFKPLIIHFEHGLSTGIMAKEKFYAIHDVLHKNGYELWMEYNDATAYQKDILADK